ncbi:MAG TPA: branched-chain amino acid ABC transporter permease, partial [Gaiellaceae bacterium]
MRPRPVPLATAIAAAAVIAVLPFALSGYHQALAAEVAVFFIAILGLDILTGYTGQISIGHGAFMAIGGYTTALLSRNHHMNLLLTVLVALGICFVAGLLVGLPALRLSGVYLALATFALAVSVPQLPLKFSKYLGGSGGVQTA